MYQTVVPFIQRALDHGLNETNIQEIYAELMKDLKQLFIITDDHFVTLGACVTEVTQYYSHRSIKCAFLGGDRLEDWYKELDKELVKFAKEQNCKYIEIIGRKGWIRKLAPIDYKFSYYYLHKEV